MADYVQHDIYKTGSKEHTALLSNHKHTRKQFQGRQNTTHTPF